MKKFFYLIAWVSIFSVIGMVILFTYWYVYPYKVIEFGKGNETFVESTVHAGGYLQMHRVSCKYTDLPIRVSRQFIDGIVYQVPEFMTNIPKGCHDNIEYVFVPETLPIGDYHINAVLTVRVNPIRTMTFTVKSPVFTVIK